MKTHTLLALGLGTLLTLTIAGCKKTPERYTRFGDSPSTTSVRANERDLSTSPVVTGEKADAVTGVTLDNPGLADDSSLADREHDRATFANQTVYFEYDHSNVKANEASKIDQVAAQFKSMGTGYDLLIEGHCDERGTEEYNRSLGDRRANALREKLATLGVDPKKIVTVSYGEDRPVDNGHSEAAYAKNRRGDFVLLTPPSPGQLSKLENKQ